VRVESCGEWPIYQSRIEDLALIDVERTMRNDTRIGTNYVVKEVVFGGLGQSRLSDRYIIAALRWCSYSLKEEHTIARTSLFP
jgi:hypothetical protein